MYVLTFTSSAYLFVFQRKDAAVELRASLRELCLGKFTDKLSRKLIVLKHIPPFSPLQGGSWERLVCQMKTLLKPIPGKEYYRNINDEELITYFKEVEGILNWQPLTILSDDPSDFECKSYELIKFGITFFCFYGYFHWCWRL